MARSTAKNSSSLTWATRFLVCTTLWAAERRVTGLVTASTGTLRVRERTVLFALSPPTGGRPRGTVECHFAHAQL